jgi:DNA-binding PadR family transcriptional regulator
MRARDRIEHLLQVANRPLAATEVAKITRARPEQVYASLFRLEETGMVTSEWVDDPPHRLRLYRWNQA